jgi:hypothetical protein
MSIIAFTFTGIVRDRYRLLNWVRGIKKCSTVLKKGSEEKKGVDIPKI